jgi:hypothetical protein
VNGRLENVGWAVVVTLMTAFTGACDKSPIDDGADMSHSPLPLNRKVTLGTDGASFFVYHPADLQHRMDAPITWPYYHFACGPEFEAGRLVAFVTGADGDYGIRVTDGPLTDREKKWWASSWDFRYVVRHERFFLDGGYGLPSEIYLDESDEELGQWFTLPNGKYKVTVSAINWSDEPGAMNEEGYATDDALPGYVIQFSRVDDLGTIKSSATPVEIETSLIGDPGGFALPGKSFAEYNTYDDNVESELAESYVVLVDQRNATIPGFTSSMKVSQELFEAVWGQIPPRDEAVGDRIKQLVIASSDEAPCLGVVATPSGGEGVGDEVWRIALTGHRLVNITAFERGGKWVKCTVEPLDRPSSDVPPESLIALKRSFAVYAKSNKQYRSEIKFPDFEAESVASMKSSAPIARVLIHHVQMPVATRLKLLQLSDVERVKQLQAILADAVN